MPLTDKNITVSFCALTAVKILMVAVLKRWLKKVKPVLYFYNSKSCTVSNFILLSKTCKLFDVGLLKLDVSITEYSLLIHANVAQF